MVGLTPTPECFFIFLALLIAFSLVMAQELGAFAAVSPTAALLQALSACFLLHLQLQKFNLFNTLCRDAAEMNSVQSLA